MKHTPTPWKLENRKKDGVMGNVITYGTILIAQVFSWGKKSKYKMREQSQANAEFIVRAVNSHEALVGALKALVYILYESGEVLHDNGIGYVKELNDALEALKQAGEL